jgi:hypothetical protein
MEEFRCSFCEIGAGRSAKQVHLLHYPNWSLAFNPGFVPRSDWLKRRTLQEGVSCCALAQSAPAVHQKQPPVHRALSFAHKTPQRHRQLFLHDGLRPCIYQLCAVRAGDLKPEHKGEVRPDSGCFIDATLPKQRSGWIA